MSLRRITGTWAWYTGPGKWIRQVLPGWRRWSEFCQVMPEDAAMLLFTLSTLMDIHEPRWISTAEKLKESGLELVARAEK